MVHSLVVGQFGRAREFRRRSTSCFGGAKALFSLKNRFSYKTFSKTCPEEPELELEKNPAEQDRIWIAGFGAFGMLDMHAKLIACLLAHP